MFPGACVVLLVIDGGAIRCQARAARTHRCQRASNEGPLPNARCRDTTKRKIYCNTVQLDLLIPTLVIACVLRLHFRNNC